MQSLTITKNKKVQLLILIFLLGLLFLPFNLVIAPERKLQLFDNKGNPLVGTLVRQSWDQYSLDKHGEVLLRTDSEGRVNLPKREVRTSILDLFFGALREFRKSGIHAGYSSREFVGISVNEGVGKGFHDGKGLESGKVVIDLEQ